MKNIDITLNFIFQLKFQKTSIVNHIEFICGKTVKTQKLTSDNNETVKNPFWLITYSHLGLEV